MPFRTINERYMMLLHFLKAFPSKFRVAMKQQHYESMVSLRDDRSRTAETVREGLIVGHVIDDHVLVGAICDAIFENGGARNISNFQPST